MRRIATVTTSAPLAACAACITGIDGYLPVPTKSRERNVYLPIWSGASSTMCVGFLSSGDGHDDLEAVTVVQGAGSMFGARHDVVIERDGDAVTAQGKRYKQRGNGNPRRYLLFRAIDRKPHRPEVFGLKAFRPRLRGLGGFRCALRIECGEGDGRPFARDERGDRLGGDRRQQDPVAIVAGRDDVPVDGRTAEVRPAVVRGGP